VNSQWWSDDDELLAALGDALRYSNEVPRRFVEVGKAVYAWHGIDAELAALTYDSAAAGAREELAVATREQLAPLRALTFASNQLRVHIDVLADALHGQVVPEQPGEIEVRTVDGGVCTVSVDEVGWFVIRPIPTGSFSLRCHMLDGTTVRTDWITL
jgi:hypothetical protein